jgi:PAS domain-containing protein
VFSGDAMIQLDSLYDDIINGNVTKEDFLLKFKNLEAFSKEDRLKLQIIDASPFTMWACNIDNKIRLWDHRCQELYGYGYEEAINKSFIDLFVAPDEKIKAELDCIEIIKNNIYIINLAGDISKYSNSICLMTNCFKVTDMDSGEDLQAEIGLEISDKDWERLTIEYNQILETNKKLENKRKSFKEECDEFYENCIYRINELKKDVHSGQIQALKQHSHDSYKQGADNIKTSIETCQQKLENVNTNYLSKIDEAKVEKDLETHIHDFRLSSIIISDEIEITASSLLQLQIKTTSISSTSNKYIEKSEVVVKKDSFIDITNSRKTELLTKIEKKISGLEDNMESPGIVGNNKLTENLENSCNQLEIMKNEIIHYFAERISCIKNCENINEIEELERKINRKIDTYLEKIKSKN